MKDYTLSQEKSAEQPLLWNVWGIRAGMRKFFSKAEEIYAGIANAAGRKFSHSGCLKTGKVNRVQYTKAIQRTAPTHQGYLSWYFDDYRACSYGLPGRAQVDSEQIPHFKRMLHCWFSPITVVPHQNGVSQDPFGAGHA